MPKTRAVVDSSHVAVASPRKRPLKRSASTASLPTPPCTRHKRKHSRTPEQETDSDSDSGSEHHSGTYDGAILFGNKKRRTSASVNGETVDEDEEEHEFWAPYATEEVQEKSQEKKQSVKQEQKRIGTRSSSTSSPVRTALKAPVSPPPSRRQKTSRTTRLFTPKNTVSTPLNDSSGPVRDSPNNPFLADSLNDEGSLTEPRTPTPSTKFAEKPTITYVFRGMKAQFDNPLYHLSPSALARAALPVEDPEYSPTAACPPKLLFPEAHKARKLRARPSHSRQSSDAAELPKRLTFQKELELLQKAEEEPVRQ